jgi:predicted permease
MGIRDWKLRLRALVAPDRVERDLQDELAFHIECEARKLIDRGVPPDEARRTAQARFGSTTAVADECRDERGTALVDNTVRDVRFALRSFRRAPLAAITIVATVAIGLGVVAVVFTVLNTFVFRVDGVPDVTEMHAVEIQAANGEPSLFTRPEFDALRRDTSVFTDAYAALAGVDLRVEGRMMGVTLVSGNFFEVLRLNPVMGRALMPADDAPGGGNPVIVLSDKGWSRHFDRDPRVLGRTVLVGGAPFEIVGVMPAGFRGLEFTAPDLWAPLSQLGQFRPIDRGREDSVAVEIIGRLKPGVSMERARAQLDAWDSNRRTKAERGAHTIVLEPRRGTVSDIKEAAAVFTPLFFVFGLILVIGCANVANLLLARGVARQREIGIRLSLGASRRRIVRQLMTESCLLAMVAAAGGYLISRVALEVMSYWALRTMPVDLGDPNIDLTVPAADWRVAVFLVIAALGAMAFFALIPALHATRVDPVRTMRGELVKDARPGRSRNVLIGVQVFASALLLICAAIFLRSALASSRFDPGLRTADTVIIDINNESKRAAMLQAVAAEPIVTARAGVRPHIMAVPHHAFAEVGGTRAPVAYKFISPEYFDVFGIPIVRGRSFTIAEGEGEQDVVIVSEAVANAAWPNGGAVGATMRLEQDFGSGPPPKDQPVAPPRLVTVVGVSRDTAGFRLTDSEDVDIFLPTSVNAPRTAVAARVSGDPDVARRTLLADLDRIDPHMGAIVTMRTLARMETIFLGVAFWVSVALGGLALMLTVSGLFSVLSYLVEQRRREIGVRMALGASSRKVAQLILAQTTRPVLVGLLAGAGLAASLATALIAMPAGAEIAQIVHVADPVAYAASLLVIVTACLLAAWIPATRAARLNPMQTIRQD